MEGARLCSRSEQRRRQRHWHKQGAELVKGDLNDRASIEAALQGAYGVFSFQNFWRPDIGKEGELRQGKNVADAAKAVGVKHLVYSSVGAAHRGMGQEHFATKWDHRTAHSQTGSALHHHSPCRVYGELQLDAQPNFKRHVHGLGTGPDKTLQLVAVDDIGAFVAMAFDQPQEFLGKTIEFAGDELTEPQIAATFSKVVGRPVKLEDTKMPEGQQPTPEQMAMFQFFNGQGYDADIPALRKMYPQLKTLERYLRENGWVNAQPTAETQTA